MTDTDTDTAPTNTDTLCGEPKANGDPCQRPTNWGIEGATTGEPDGGPCRDHCDDFTNPRKLDTDTEQRLFGAAQAGATLDHCAQYAGITRQTLYEWLNEGEEHEKVDRDTPLREFYLTFQRARASGAIKHLQEADHEFILQASYGYTKTEKHDVDMTASVNLDPSEAYVEALKAHEKAKAKDHPASNTDGPGRTL